MKTLGKKSQQQLIRIYISIMLAKFLFLFKKKKEKEKINWLTTIS
jgi:hypothetical protein